LLAGSFAGSGIVASVVQRPQLTPAHLESAMWLALAAGAALSLLTFTLSPLAAPVFGGEVDRLIRLASPCFLVAGLGAVSQGLLQRDLSFRLFGAINLISSLIGTAVTVGLAVAGLDAEALVIGTLTALGTTSALSAAAFPPPTPRRHRSELREIGRFGLPNVGANAAFLGYQNIDYAVLGARVDASLVGFYWRAFGLGVNAQGRLSTVLSSLGLPLYARAESHADRLALRSRIVSLQTGVIYPLLGGLILLAPWVVPTLFGDRWEPSVELTQILALVGIVSAVQSGVGPLITALGRPDAMLRWNLTNLVTLAIIVYFAAPEGLVFLCWAVCVYRFARFVGSHYFLLTRIARVPMKQTWLDSAPALAASAAAVAVGGGLQELAFGGAAATLLEAVAVGLVVVVTYLIVLRIFFPATLELLIATTARLLRRRRPTDAPPIAATEATG
jgi:O-antigen/teichoic acid export membrane protein